MQNSVKERIAKLREEIAQLTEADRLYSQVGEASWRDGGSRTSASETGGNPRRVGGTYRLKKAARMSDAHF
jgi:hypothetical protein